MTHYSADGYTIEVGAKFWDNNLQVVQIEEVAVDQNSYADTGEIQTWHKTTRGRYDTLSGKLTFIGRLARYFEGKNAENYEVGTRYQDVKHT